jgi:phage shock protein PspC (stress-responsive transcriptional regulator)
MRGFGDDSGMEQEITTTENPTSPPPHGSKELTRVVDDRILGGVAVGIARRLDLPTWLVRVLFIVFSFGGGLGIAVYAAFWAFIRSEDEPDTIAERFFSRTTSTGSWVGVALIFVAVLVLLDNVSFLSGGVIWAVGLLAIGLLLYSGELPRLFSESASPKEGVQQMTTRTDTKASAATEEHVGGGAGATTPPPPPPTPTPTPPILPPARPPKPKSMLGRVTFGVMAIALGVLALLDNTTTLVDPSARHYIALAMTVLGIGLITGAVVGRARWLILVGVLGLPFLFGSPALEYDFDDWGSATVSQTPTDFADLPPTYDHTIGRFVVDLRELPWNGQQVDLDVSMSIGELLILLPDDVSVTGTADVGIGHVEFLHDQSSGLGPELRLVADGPNGTINLDAKLGIGQIDIDRFPANN